MSTPAGGGSAGLDSPRPPVALPQDTRVDRRTFLQRMGALSAVAAAGAAGAAGMAGWPDAAAAQVALPSAGVAPLPGFDLPGGVSPSLTPGALADFWAEARRLGAQDGVHRRVPEELTAWEVGVRLRDGSLDPLELVEACLARIRRLDGVYMAFNTVMEADARREAEAVRGELAREAERGARLDARILLGVPVAIKDNVYLAGHPTTANSHMFRDFVPTWDATLVTRLRAAGALGLGKTQMGPLATTRALTPDGQVTTVNAWAPLQPRVSPGGSSSGSATAVASRMATSSMGTQTGGSVTVPASSQGLTGLKPTMGRVSLRGVIPLTYTRDHPGPLARDARDAALMLQAMAGPDPLDPRTLGLPPVPNYLAAATISREGARIPWPTRLGVPPGWAEVEGGRGERRRRFLAAMEAGGVEVLELTPPPGWSELGSGTFNAGRLPERSEPFLPWLRDDVRLFGVTLSTWIQGLLLSGDEYLKAQRARLALLQLTLDGIFHRCDAVIQGNHVPFDMMGLPLVTFPLGFEEGLPDGVLLGAPPFGEERLLALAALWQATTDHHQQRPADPDPVEASRRGPGGWRGRLDTEEVADLSQ